MNHAGFTLSHDTNDLLVLCEEQVLGTLLIGIGEKNDEECMFLPCLRHGPHCPGNRLRLSKQLLLKVDAGMRLYPFYLDQSSRGVVNHLVIALALVALGTGGERQCIGNQDL